MKKDYQNILLIQLGDVGDVVLTIPTIDSLHNHYPKAKISIILRKPFGSLLSAQPNLFAIIETSKPKGSLLDKIRDHSELARQLKRTGYDLTIDLRTGDRGAILSFLTGAKNRIGRSARQNQFWHKLVFTQTISKLPTIANCHPGAAQSLSVLKALGIEPTITTPKLYISPQLQQRVYAILQQVPLLTQKKFLSINPFSRWAYKEWDTKKWQQLIDYCWKTYKFPCILVGTQEEQMRCQEIIRGRETYSFNFAGRTSLAELSALLAMSSLHIGVDSAAPHIAFALNTPTLTIHGPSDWRSWRITDLRNRVVQPNLNCVPCNQMGCENKGISRCLLELTTLQVLTEIDKLIPIIQQGDHPAA